jgi:hypothetical protein
MRRADAHRGEGLKAFLSPERTICQGWINDLRHTMPICGPVSWDRSNARSALPDLAKQRYLRSPPSALPLPSLFRIVSKRVQIYYAFMSDGSKSARCSAAAYRERALLIPTGSTGSVILADGS